MNRYLKNEANTGFFQISPFQAKFKLEQNQIQLDLTSVLLAYTYLQNSSILIDNLIIIYY